MRDNEKMKVAELELETARVRANDAALQRQHESDRARAQREHEQGMRREARWDRAGVAVVPEPPPHSHLWQVITGAGPATLDRADWGTAAAEADRQAAHRGVRSPE